MNRRLKDDLIDNFGLMPWVLLWRLRQLDLTLAGSH